MKETSLWYSLLWKLAFIIFKAFFGIKIQGEENIPSVGGVILASNHLSYLDPIVIALLTRRKINFMAKEELFKNSLFSFLIGSLGAFPLKRGGFDGAAYKKALYILREGKVLVLFPEGTRRQKKGEISSLQKGAARIALSAGVPLVPIAIQGTDKVLPRGKKMVRRAKINVRIGELFPGEKLSYTKDETDKLHTRLIKSINELLSSS
ncbi:MAG: lysophospholipid acyltransferase family protein [Candidatus Aerophobetes bacterium]|nr:lysophospholipid acyltransferase family protein [Candidatus Aerophobetes bacterium]